MKNIFKLLLIILISGCSMDKEYDERLNTCRTVYGEETSVFKRKEGQPQWFCTLDNQVLEYRVYR